MYNKIYNNNEVWKKIVKKVQKKLEINSVATAEQIATELLMFSDSFEEHASVVLLSCTLLETLLNELLVLLLTIKQTSPLTRPKAYENTRGFGNKCKLFKELTDKSLEDAFNKYIKNNFYKEWMEIKDKRNLFVHSTPYALSKDIAEKAFELAKVSFVVFKEIHNCFCLRNN